MEIESEATPLMTAYRAARARTDKTRAGAIIKKFGGDPANWAMSVPAKNVPAAIKALQVLVSEGEDADEAAANGEHFADANRERQNRHEVEHGFARAEAPKVQRMPKGTTMESLAEDAYGARRKPAKSLDSAAIYDKWNKPSGKTLADEE